MTNEEKQIVLKDLCARLPYGLKVKCERYPFPVTVLYAGNVDEVKFKETGGIENIYIIKPYLRPMSSMTEEEYDNLCNSCTWLWFKDDLRTVTHGDYKCYDWLNAHHFDYRGLIEKGLALEAPDGMYSDKNEKTAVPQTLSEAISYLTNNISDEDKQYIVKNGAISVHHSLGRWIRNNWGLWENSELKRNLEKEGLTHPDDMSNYIIEEFLKTLTDSEK